MSAATNGTPPALLVHDGELCEVRYLLEALRVPFVERRGLLRAEDVEVEWGLLVATPGRLLEPALGAARTAQRIAVCDRDSPTPPRALQRAGIHTLVRRPVHPAALRGLLLRALYRGPEKRRSPRTPVGAPVAIRMGWRQRPAILADLSIEGCRLLCAAAPPQGRDFTLCVPARVGGGRAFHLKARVLRHLGHEDGQACFSARFEGVRIAEAEHLERTLQAHACGPARIGPGAVATPAAAPTAAGAASTHARREGPDAPGARDRRARALAEAASRVLVGRDISLGGMRVEPNPRLCVGDDVRLAVHVEQLSVPLVVTAKVHRDDGERGLVLRFHDLEPQTSRALHALLDALPVIEPSPSDHGTGLIVSELLSS